MNAKQILMAAAIVTLSAAAALAEEAAAPSPAPAATSSAANSSHKGRHEMKFTDRKAHALERLEKAAARIQAKQACVQAATDKDSLQACFPKRGQGKGDKGGWHRHGDADKANAGAAATTPAPAGK